MNTVLLNVKNLLNQPMIKEGVKNVAGSVTFAFGLVEIYDIYKMARGCEMETVTSTSKWVQAANKVVNFFAKISLILSAGVSRPGVFIISSLVGCVFSTSQLNQMFGPNTIFAINPRHPRHILSIAAVILGLPSLLLTSDHEIRLKTLFNTITSRPLLHIGNQLMTRI
jgi:hypothetical protein